MARHAGAPAPPPPQVFATLGLPTRQQWSDASSWTVGLCWLCEGEDKVVAWIGPVILMLGADRRRSNAYACADCLERITVLAAWDLRKQNST